MLAIRPYAPVFRFARRLLRRVRSVRRVARGVAVVPHVCEAVLFIPRLSRQLDEVIANTASLPTLSRQLDHVVVNTDHLSHMVGHTARLAADASVLPQTQSDLLVMQAAIVQMRADTSAMVEDLARLRDLEHAVPELVPLVGDLRTDVRQLAGIAAPLHGAALRVGRLSDRLPARGGQLNGGWPGG